MSGALSAQVQNAMPLQELLVSPWLVTIKDQARTLVLRVAALKQAESNSFTLDATYGFIDGRQDVVEAKAVQAAEALKVSFKTQSGNRYEFSQASELSFTGTYTDTKGNVKTVSATRTSEIEVKDHLASYQVGRMRSALITPADDVPKACAAFAGRWTGHWPGYGQTWLWVTEVSASCVAKCMNWNNAGFPSMFQTCDIRNGVLERLKPDGVERYEIHGDEVWATYDMGSSRNNTVFKKLSAIEK